MLTLRSTWLTSLLLGGFVLVLLLVVPGAAGAAVRPQSQAGQPVVVEGGSYLDVGPTELAGMLAAKDFLLINVHIPYAGEIEGTDLFIPFDETQARLAELPAERDARLVLYCRSGAMSAIAARVLVSNGYSGVVNLVGGMEGWTDAGYPLLDLAR